MNILLVTGIFYPDIGGPATYTEGLASELESRGHTVRVTTLSWNKTGSSDAGRPYDITRLRRDQLLPVRVAKTTKRIIADGRWADITYVQGLFPEAAIAKTFVNTPVVGRVVGDKAWEIASQRDLVSANFEEFQTEQFGWRVELLRRLRTWSVRRMDRVIAATDYFADQIARWGVPKRDIVRINNFIDTDPPKTETDPHPGSHSHTAVTVGRLVDWKRMDVLIDAVSNISDLDLVIIGDGPERECLQAKSSEAGVADRVHFIGKQPHETIPEHISKADVFALPSTWESFSIVVLEAMVAGTPVIASDIGGPNEIITDGTDGLLITPGSEAELTIALTRVLEDAEFAAQLTEEAAHTIEAYSLETVADEVESMFRALEQ